MECNKDEAARAKSLAESKIAEKDFSSAKKFALKAQTLFPELIGISQMLTTLNVYLASQKKVNGMPDWYGVLEVSPTADEESIKKQYHKFALALHPDKNSSVGAKGAFQLISDAWIVLSDKLKRQAYDILSGHCKVHTNQGPSAVFTNGPFPQPGPFTQPAGSSTLFSGGLFSQPAGPSKAFSTGPFSQPSHTVNPFTQPGGPSASSTEGLFKKFAAQKPPTPKTEKKIGKKAGPSNQAVKSFWTVCDKCKVQYEYRDIYRNLTLLCPNCKSPFLATEIPQPVFKSKSPKPGPWFPFRQGPVENGNGENFRGKDVVVEGKKPEAGKTGLDVSMQARQGPVPAPAGASSSAGPSVVTKVTTSRNKGKQPMAMNAESNGNGEIHEGQNGNTGVTDCKYEAGAIAFPKLKDLETRKILVYKARMHLLGIKDLGISLDKQREKKPETGEAGPTLKKHKEKGEKSKSISNGSSQRKAKVDLPSEVNNVEVMTVPDPDFYDFDKDRSVKSFAENDVWATYDDDGGMPRNYAMIHKVVSKKPFVVKFSFLNSTSNEEFSPDLPWIKSGFPKTCGGFHIGKHKTCKQVNTFSEKMRWSKGPKGAIMIFPKKGDMWALYRNWSHDWDEHTSDDVVQKYDVVMVLDGYDEKRGLISVAPLVKVAGFKTVFCVKTGEEVVSVIRREEMFRFSHKVPHHELTGNEAPGVPDGCVELDPAALPMELLEIEVGAEGVNT